MTAEDIADTIAILCQHDSSVTHGVLRRRIGKAVLGNLDISYEQNLVLFVCASQEFANAIKILRSEIPARVVLKPIDAYCLLFDAGPIPSDMPFAKRIPKGGYKHPHFVPMCFDKASAKNVEWMSNQQKAAVSGRKNGVMQ